MPFSNRKYSDYTSSQIFNYKVKDQMNRAL